MKRLMKALFGRFDGERCPHCGSYDTCYNEYHRDWVCRKCGKYFG